MSYEDNGGSAFPRTVDEYDGITIRDYFAAHCLSHLVARMDWMHQDAASYFANAKQCYEMADAMIEARKE